MFELDFRNLTVVVSLIIHASLLWILYRYGRRTLGGKAYSVAILAIAGWIFPMILYRSHLFDQTLIWAKLLYIMASFTSTSFFYFTLVFTKTKQVKRWHEALIFIENVAIVFLCAYPGALIREVIISPVRETFIVWGLWYWVYASHISLFFIAGFLVLFRYMRRSTGTVYNQTRSILIGYFFASNLAMVTNLVLPWFGYFELNWLGQFFSTLVAVFTTYAILRHQLLNIKVITTEFFLLLINSTLIIQFVLSGTFSRFVVNGIILGMVMFISYLLIQSVKNEVEQKEQMTKLADSLQRANVRLKQLDKQKTEFLSIASHQLRTPLSIIKGYIELIQDGAYGKITPEAFGVLKNMDESNERLVKLVDEFLNISRIEQGRTKFVFKEQDISALITPIVDELRQKANEKNLVVAWEKPTAVIKAVIDEEKIHHVIYNYVDNAIKYTPDGKVVIRVREENNGVTVTVEDTGLGFTDEDTPNFFNKFYRGKNVRGTNVNGTGLGIYVCKQFIEGHLGHVWAKSAGLGKGSEFGFWVPYDAPDREKDNPISNEQLVVNQYGS